MKPNEFRMMLFSRDLERTHRFYSTLGMVWHPQHQELRIGTSGLPKQAEESPELARLPHLWGHLANIELMFYLKPSISDEHRNTIIMLGYEDSLTIEEVIKRLVVERLFVPSPEFDEKFRRLVLDPDSQQIELYSPDPFRP